jgi:hypothetical protein
MMAILALLIIIKDISRFKSSLEMLCNKQCDILYMDIMCT